VIDLGLFLLSAASLAFEVNLTRLFSVAQFHHFAFLVVSLALLGYGASGTLLSIFPRLGRAKTGRTLGWLAWGFAATAIASYVITIWVPLDTFRIARDWRQLAVLALHYGALSSPFLCIGLALAVRLAAQPARTSTTYAANLAGSASGCIIAVVAPSWVGGEGVVFLCAALAIVAALCIRCGRRFELRAVGLVAIQVALAAALLGVAVWLPPSLAVRLSPYKGLSYALLYPDAAAVSQRWNGFSRVDVVRSSSIRSLPGRGFRCEQQPPPQLGLTVDGDSLTPISQLTAGFGAQPFTDCLLTALPFRLRPGAQTLVLEAHGGFDVIVALSEGAAAVSATEPNPLIVEAVDDAGPWAGNLYRDSRITVFTEESRAFARQTDRRFDVIVLSLTSVYRPVTSGAYSLAEDYRYTVEAFGDFYALLRPGGLLAITRWLQVPPSEALRAFATAVEAVERAGGDPRSDLVALRSYQQMLLLARNGSFTAGELNAIREFAGQRAFDLVHLPDLHPAEVNKHNVLPSPQYHAAFAEILGSADRAAWYRSYSYRVEPPTDNRPFFGHYFKWRQAPQVLAQAGHVWQPFGGAGYFVLLALLTLAIVLATGMILVPLVSRRRSREDGSSPFPVVAYFGLLGLGYLLVEIPLLQQFILYLSHPAYAVGIVLFTLLACSGVGSLISDRLPWAVVLVLPGVVVGYVLILPQMAGAALGASLPVRILFTVVVLAPAGILMGVPFPKGLALLGARSPRLVPWAWGINGAVSVVASVLAALLAFDWGFSAVLGLGALCYVLAWLTARYLRRSTP
jgi:hypothetical protein